MSVGLSQKQDRILKFPYATFHDPVSGMELEYDAVIADGAIRSGKTMAMGFGFILWAMSNFDNCNFGICSKNLIICERNIIKPMLDIKYLRQNFDITYLRGDGMLIIKRGKKTNYFYMFGGRDETSYTTLQGITLAGILFDEVALMPRSFVDKGIGRCSIKGAKVWFNCNPEHPSHWFKVDFIDRSVEKRYLYLHFTMEDNPSLSDEVKERYRRSFDGVFYQRYILGKWTKAEGLIHLNLVNDPSKFILTPDRVWLGGNDSPTMPDGTPKIRIERVRCGVDFGGNKSSTRFILTGFFNNGRCAVVLENGKIDHVNQFVDGDEINKQYKQFEQLCFNKYKHAFYTRADSAEQVLIKGLKKTALKSIIKNALKTPVNDRIHGVNYLLTTGRLFFMNYCTDTIEAYSTAQWSEKNPDERLDNGTSDIDSCDAFEYSIEEDLPKMLLL